MLRKFFTANKKVCSLIGPYLPQAQTNIFALYDKTVAHYMNTKVEQIIVDAGGGKDCTFAKYRDANCGTRIIAVDTSAEELVHNDDVDEKRVGDLTARLPFDSAEVDLIVSRSVLEHLEDLESFISDSERVLKSGGYSIHLLPSRFAPFVLINRALPHTLSRKVLYFFNPESKGGYPAFYDNCYHSGIRRLLAKYGFEIVDERFSYYQSPYFRFFVPFFLVSALYEMVIWVLGARDLAAYVLIVARKSSI